MRYLYVDSDPPTSRESFQLFIRPIWSYFYTVFVFFHWLRLRPLSSIETHVLESCSWKCCHELAGDLLRCCSNDWCDHTRQ